MVGEALAQLLLYAEFTNTRNKNTMKLIKYLFAVAAITGALSLTAKADLLFLGAEAFTDGGNNSPDQNLIELGNFVDTTGFTLCGNFEELNGGDQNIDVMAGSYLVVHYGKGKGGSSKGGGLEFYQVINGETNVTVPGNGNVGGNDPFGHGGISSIREFCPPGTNMPDSGTTAMLLGLLPAWAWCEATRSDKVFSVEQNQNEVAVR
jgi:hypothetical protein